MFTKKEIAWVIIAIIIFGFIIGWSEQPTYSPIVFLFAFIILMTSILAKKITGPIYNIQVEHKIWSFQRWGWYERSKFKKPFPIGLILPFLFSFISLGLVKIMVLLQFNPINLKKKRVLKKRGQYRYSEINDSDIAFTAAWGFWALIALAIIAFYFKQSELVKYSIYYGLWNLIPISNLDGTKLFFGSLINWILLVIVYIVSLILVLV